MQKGGNTLLPCLYAAKIIKIQKTDRKIVICDSLCLCSQSSVSLFSTFKCNAISH